MRGEFWTKKLLFSCLLMQNGGIWGNNKGNIAPTNPVPEADMADKKIGPAAAPQPGKKMTKMDGVRQALRDLGKNAMPGQIQDHLKQKFGLDMTVAHISNYKSDILRKKKRKKKARAKTAEAEPVAAKSSAAPATNRAAGSISLEDLQTTKALVGRVGADQLRSLIDLLK
jgi:hypothetical protein